MKIYVDGDACPVKKTIVHMASKLHIAVVMLMSICHMSEPDNYSEYVWVDNSNQSVDMAILNRVKKSDIVVTDDYGLASLLLMKSVFCVSSRGLIYTLENIDQLMLKRHMNAKIMKGGGRIKGPTKRNKNDDNRFAESLNKLIYESLQAPRP